MALTFSVPDTELSLTLANRRAEVVDNIFKGTAFLNALRRFGAVDTVSGGNEMVVPIRFAKNTTFGSFDSYDILDTTPQDTETSAKYPWAQDYATITLAWTEEMKNQGRGKLIDILNQKINDATDTIRDGLNTQLLATAPAAGSKDPISLTEHIQTAPGTNPARTASIGGISGNAQSWWRNKFTSGGAFSVSDMNTMYNDVSDGVEPPTFLLTSQTIFEYYENSQVGQIRYADTKMADAGFQNLMFKQVPILWEPLIGITNSLYFVNTKYLRLQLMSGADFITTDFITPDNQAAKTAKILWMGNLICTARRRQGTLHTITAPA
jgi:hypothetical protein